MKTAIEILEKYCTIMNKPNTENCFIDSHPSIIVNAMEEYADQLSSSGSAGISQAEGGALLPYNNELMGNTLHGYLFRNIQKGIIDFTLRAEIKDDGVEFYIHPSYVDGETKDFVACTYLVTEKRFCGKDD